MRTAAWLVAAAVVSAGCISWDEELEAYCADGGGGCPDAGPGGNGGDAGTEAPSLTVLAGSGQQAPGGLDFATPPLVRAVADGGAAIAGVQVTVTCPATPPTCSFLGAPSATAETDTAGYAYLPSVTAGSDPGTYEVTVTAPGFEATSLILTNTSPVPYALVAPELSAADTVTTVAAVFPTELVFEVVGSDGVPFSGAWVRFTTPSSGPSALFVNSGTTTHEVTTGTSGEASTGQLRAGPQAGRFDLTATVIGEDGADLLSMSVVLEALPGPPSGVQIVSGDSQRVATGGALVQPLVARVVDAYDNGVGAGVAAEFVNGASGQQCLFSSNDTSTEAVTTDAEGIVQTGCRTSEFEGTFNVTVRVISDPSIASTFAVTAVTPQRIGVAGGNQQSVPRSGAFEGLSVFVEAASAPVPGATVTFNAPSTEPTATFVDTGTRTTTAISDENGIATSAALTPNGVGAFQVSATEPHLGGSMVLLFDLQTTE